MEKKSIKEDFSATINGICMQTDVAVRLFLNIQICIQQWNIKDYFLAAG